MDSDTSLTPAEQVVINWIKAHEYELAPSTWYTQVAEHFGMSEFRVKRIWYKYIDTLPGRPPAA